MLILFDCGRFTHRVESSRLWIKYCDKYFELKNQTFRP
jgi:hypothetical protein